MFSFSFVFGILNLLGVVVSSDTIYNARGLSTSSREFRRLKRAVYGNIVIATNRTNITLSGEKPYIQASLHGWCHELCDDCSARSDGNECPMGVSMVVDGCNCCQVCARQLGDRCNAMFPCDTIKQLHCVYLTRNNTYGFCQVIQGHGCIVDGVEYKDGAIFHKDCRTQCMCQNGTYVCASLCPHEIMRPSDHCLNARLHSVQHGCCREWICDNIHWKTPTPRPCVPRATEWSQCSATCGTGVSVRSSNHNPDCSWRSESRLCIARACSSSRYRNETETTTTAAITSSSTVNDLRGEPIGGNTDALELDTSSDGTTEQSTSESTERVINEEKRRRSHRKRNKQRRVKKE